MRVNWPLAAWVGATTFVVVADVALAKTNQPMMSTVFRDTVRHPLKRWPVVVLWSYLTAHLFLDLPRDPLRWLGERLGEKKL